MYFSVGGCTFPGITKTSLRRLGTDTSLLSIFPTSMEVLYSEFMRLLSFLQYSLSYWSTVWVILDPRFTAVISVSLLFRDTHPIVLPQIPVLS